MNSRTKRVASGTLYIDVFREFVLFLFGFENITDSSNVMTMWFRVHCLSENFKLSFESTVRISFSLIFDQLHSDIARKRWTFILQRCITNSQQFSTLLFLLADLSHWLFIMGFTHYQAPFCWNYMIQLLRSWMQLALMRLYKYYFERSKKLSVAWPVTVLQI